MELPKPKKSKFMYQMNLVLSCMNTDFFKYINKQIWKELTSEELDSIMASYLVMV